MRPANDLVLVHGAYHGAWCWEQLTPELERRGYATRAVDLPIGDPDAGAAEYARTVESAISDLEEPIVVGHSMAGLVLPIVAAARPVRLMVFLAALLPVPRTSLEERMGKEEIFPDYGPSVEFTHTGNGVFTLEEGTATELVYGDLPPGLASWAIERLRPQSYRFMREVTPLIRWPDTPSAYVACREDRMINPAWEIWAARQRLGIEPHMIDGGHSPFLSRPSDLADLLQVIAT